MRCQKKIDRKLFLFLKIILMPKSEMHKFFKVSKKQFFIYLNKNPLSQEEKKFLNTNKRELLTDFFKIFFYKHQDFFNKP